ncbi:MAG TPA: BPSL0067 family protein [Janthinobacterium sp.]|jgi:hypothetical protein|nr:BPSL0067 family protein [Janthinobacterium sp.]
MPYIYANVQSIIGDEKVGTTQCVALVQKYAGVPHTSTWTPGAKVLDNKDIRPGTAIATFRNGRYLSADSGNHAAFFLSLDKGGFNVVDQWKDKPNRPVRNIEKRLITALNLPPRKDGSWPHESDNADAYFVIEALVVVKKAAAKKAAAKKVTK